MREPYVAARQSVDFILPESGSGGLDVKGDFGKWLKGKKYFKGKDAPEVMAEIAQWAYDYSRDNLSAHGENEIDKENLSLKYILTRANKNERKGECTERTNFLYAIMMHAKEEMKRNGASGLNKASFGFASVNGFGGRHVCLTANVEGEERPRYYDLAYAVSKDYVEKHYKSSSVTRLNLPQYVATLLSNRAGDIRDAQNKGSYKVAGRRWTQDETIAIYSAALNLAPEVDYLRSDAFNYYAGVAGSLWNEGKKDEAKQIAQKAYAIWETIPDEIRMDALKQNRELALRVKNVTAIKDYQPGLLARMFGV